MPWRPSELQKLCLRGWSQLWQGRAVPCDWLCGFAPRQCKWQWAATTHGTNRPKTALVDRMKSTDDFVLFVCFCRNALPPSKVQAQSLWLALLQRGHGPYCVAGWSWNCDTSVSGCLGVQVYWFTVYFSPLFARGRCGTCCWSNAFGSKYVSRLGEFEMVIHRS